MAIPEKKTGTVRVVHFDKGSKTQLIDAHTSAIASLALNNDGTLLATSSNTVRNKSNNWLGNSHSFMGHRNRG